MQERPRTLFWTIGGTEVNLDPTRHDDIKITDIAHSLSMQSRFGGHCNRFYSVAEHSINVAKLLPALYKREGLLHDSGEAYITDIPTPIKRMSPEFEKVEHVFLKKIGLEFGLDLCNMGTLVKQADYLMLRKEALENTNIPRDICDTFTSTFCSPETADMMLEAAGISLRYYTPRLSSELFLEEFTTLFPDYKC